MPEPTDQFVTTDDGFALFVRVHGTATDRTPVLCLPGLTRNSRDFSSLAARMATDRMVVTFDFRGRGRSDLDPSGESYLPDRYAADAIGVLDAVGFSQACLIGTSLGGAVSTLVAVLHPDRVAGLLLNDVGPVLEEDGFRRIQSYAGEFEPVATWPEMVEQLRAVAGSTAPDLTDDQWLHLAEQQCRRFDDGLIRPDHDPNLVAGLGDVDPTSLPDTWPLFDNLGDLPVVLLRGALSDLLSAETVAEMQRRRPGLVAVTVPERGHAPTLDEPESVAAIGQLLAELDSSDRSQHQARRPDNEKAPPMSTQPLSAAIATAHDVLTRVDTSKLGDQSPCASWTVGELINHLVDAQAFFQAGLAGEPPSTGGDDHSKGDFVAAFDAAAQSALDAFGEEGALAKMVSLPFGDMPGAAFMGLAINDTLVHAWDIAKGTGQDTNLAPELAEQVLEQSRASIRPDFRGPEGAPFGPEAQAPEGACAADRLAAFLGRTV